MKPTLNTLLFILLALTASAQTEATGRPEAPLGTGNFPLDMLFIAVVILVFILLLVAITLLRTFNKLSKELLNPTPFVKQEERVLEYNEWLALKKSKPAFWNKILGLRPIEEEKDIMLDHEFDGIAELDNPTPAWFMWLFYGTIAIAVGYMLTYHVFDWGKLQDEEYVIEMEQAEQAKKAYLATAANLIDENSVTETDDMAAISAGQALYTSNCVACHGDKGQGIVGPNLTDEYWLHGGSISSVFKSIKYGIPEKGMISWEKTLTPKQISDVSNYIKSLKGSNPANPKAPQGNKQEG